MVLQKYRSAPDDSLLFGNTHILLSPTFKRHYPQLLKEPESPTVTVGKRSKGKWFLPLSSIASPCPFARTWPRRPCAAVEHRSCRCDATFPALPLPSPLRSSLHQHLQRELVKHLELISTCQEFLRACNTSGVVVFTHIALTYSILFSRALWFPVCRIFREKSLVARTAVHCASLIPILVSAI